MEESGVNERIESLFQDFVRNKERRELKSDELLREECSFAPEMVAKRMTDRLDKGPVGEERAKQLYERRFEKKAKIEKLKEERTLAETRECTFKPRLLSKNKTPKRSKKEVFEHLYGDPMRKAKIQKKKQDDYLSQFSFTPIRVSRQRPSTSEVEGSAIDRLYSADKMKKRAQQLAETKAKMELKGATFKPQINSKFKPREETSELSVHERLFKVASKMKEKQTRLEKEREEKVMKDCPFSPTVSRGPKKGKQLNVPVHERLFNANFNKTERLREQADEIHAEECPFKPTLVSAEVGVQRSGDRVDALYLRGRDKQARRNSPDCNDAAFSKKNEDIENESECTFKPYINSRTEELAGRFMLN
eukprot:TRINITY_DN695_c0_g3_i1.p1 TRINITY_DN695_c0_g3~~TRINITY_DN695_c0_g3_i1.p1  ORF type:complete len:362 (+),score=122.39 TRINITY_DN695_c0_g3_i1:64-1149(+)